MLESKRIVVLGATLLLLSISFSPIVNGGILKTSLREISMNLAKRTILPNDHPTTQEAINTNEDGDTVLVQARTYCENMVVMVNVTALDGVRRTTSDDGEDITAEVVRRGVEVSGFTFGNSSGTRDAGLFQDSHYNTLQMNTVTADGHGRVLNVSNGNHIQRDDNMVGNYCGDYTIVDGAGGSSYLILGGDDKERCPSMVRPLHSFSSQLIGLGLDDAADSKQLMFSGDVIVVPDDYPTIQEAVDHAVDGDTIIVRAGVYYENVVVDKQLKIIGEGSSVTFVDGGRRLKDVFYVISDHVEISGFTFRNSHMYFSGIKLVEADFCVVYDNVFRKCGDSVELGCMQGNAIDDKNGVELRYSSNNVTSGNDTVSNNWGGIELWYSSNNVILGNDILINWEGIMLRYSSDNVISGNNISYNSCGIDLRESSNNNTIAGNNISNNGCGIMLLESSDNTISGNNISHNSDGIELEKSSHNVISGNNIILNDWESIVLWYSSNNIITDNFFLGDGLVVVYSYRNTVNNNTVNYKPLIYLEGRSDVVVDLDAGQVILVSCNNITVRNQNISKTDCGIQLLGSGNCVIKSNNISNNRDGIMLLKSGSNAISGNNISNNRRGVVLGRSSNNIIWGNNISKSWKAIDLGYSSNNIIWGNNISNNVIGIELGKSSDNVISGNNISSNSWGIELDECSDNVISGNDVISNRLMGIELYECSHNVISCNNILNNWKGIELGYSSNNVITDNFFLENGLFLWWCSYKNVVNNNTVNYKPLIYLEGRSDVVVDLDAGQVILVSCNNITVRNQNISKTDCGIQLLNTSNCVIKSNNISNNRDGIMLLKSGSNAISGNNISDSGYNGIVLEGSSDNVISGNNISDSGYHGVELWKSSDNTISGNNIISNELDGIVLEGSSDNVISGNNISNNDNGIEIWYSNDNILSGNNINSNNRHGVLITGSKSNKISYNNFIENGVNAFFTDSSFFNRWNKNYWDDWLGIGPKIICGVIRLGVVEIPWFNFDLRPVEEPYIIG